MNKFSFPENPTLMQIEEFRAILVKHNWKHRVLAVLCAVGALVMWVVSFTVMAWISGIIFRVLGVSWWYAGSLGIGALTVGLLAIEAVRYNKEVDQDRTFWDTAFGIDFGKYSYACEPIRVVRGTLAAGYWITEMFYSAPRLTVKTKEHAQALVSLDRAGVEHAVATFNELGRLRKWVAVERIDASGPVLRALDRLGLMWRQVEYDRVEVRGAAHLMERYFGPRM